MLTPKKKKFVMAILGGANKTEAAKIAGYSEKSAGQTGYELSKDPAVMAALQQKWLNGGVKEKPQDPIPENSGNDPHSLYKKYENPLDFLLAVMNNVGEDIDVRKDAAKAALPYLHTKKGEAGKKEQKKGAAEDAAKRFVAQHPPRLVANNGK